MSKLVPGRVFRIVRGSGCSFFALGERGFAARSQVLQSFGIKRYYRYRDDVSMICSRKQGTREFFQNVARKGPAVQAPSRRGAQEQHQVPGFASHQDGNQVRCQASLQDNISCKDPWIRHQHIPNSFIAAGQLEWSSAFSHLCRREADGPALQRRAYFPPSGQRRFQAYHRTGCEGQSVAREGRFHVFLMFLLFCGRFFGFHPGLQRELSHAFCRVLGGVSCAVVRETWATVPRNQNCVEEHPSFSSYSCDAVHGKC